MEKNIDIDSIIYSPCNSFHYLWNECGSIEQNLTLLCKGSCIQIIGSSRVGDPVSYSHFI